VSHLYGPPSETESSSRSGKAPPSSSTRSSVAGPGSSPQKTGSTAPEAIGSSTSIPTPARAPTTTAREGSPAIAMATPRQIARRAALHRRHPRREGRRRATDALEGVHSSVSTARTWHCASTATPRSIVDDILEHRWRRRAHARLPRPLRPRLVLRLHREVPPTVQRHTQWGRHEQGDRGPAQHLPTGRYVRNPGNLNDNQHRHSKYLQEPGPPFIDKVDMPPSVATGGTTSGCQRTRPTATNRSSTSYVRRLSKAARLRAGLGTAYPVADQLARRAVVPPVPVHAAPATPCGSSTRRSPTPRRSTASSAVEQTGRARRRAIASQSSGSTASRRTSEKPAAGRRRRPSSPMTR
jgi:hypothetical protein